MEVVASLMSRNLDGEEHLVTVYLSSKLSFTYAFACIHENIPWIYEEARLDACIHNSSPQTYPTFEQFPEIIFLNKYAMYYVNVS